MNAPHDGDPRSAELVTGLGAVRARIASACADAGRDPQEVMLVAVTKTYPARDVATLARLGVHDVGESKDQEARAKLAELENVPDLRWHLVGRLQTNKARSVVTYASAVHSVDRRKLVRALADAAAEHRPERLGPLDVFVQVTLDADPSRGGVVRDGVLELADAVAQRPQLRLRGVMTVPPIDAEADAAYATLRDISGELRTQHAQARSISAGMSGDLEAAVRHGATHVRVGTALLGRREPVFG